MMLWNPDTDRHTPRVETLASRESTGGGEYYGPSMGTAGFAQFKRALAAVTAIVALVAVLHFRDWFVALPNGLLRDGVIAAMGAASLTGLTWAWRQI